MGLFTRKEKRGEEVTADTVITELLTNGMTADKAMEIPAFAASVDYIANRFKTIPVRLYREKDGKTEEVYGDERVRLLNDGSDDDIMTGPEMKAAIVRDYLTRGRGYAYIERSRNRVTGIYYVRASDVAYTTPIDPIHRRASYVIGGKVYPTYDIVRLLRHTKDGVSGKSVINEDPLMLSIAYMTMQFEEKLTASGGCRKAFLQSEKKLEKDALERLKEGWRRLWTLNGDAAIALNAGVTVKEASSSPVELQLNENKTTNAGQIYELFGLSADVVKGKANPEEVANAVQNAIIPIVTDFEGILNKTLLLECEKADTYFACDLKELTKGDIVKRYNAYKIALDANFMQLDEVRYAEDLPPLGANFIKLGLNDVLYDPATKTIYTPNTNAYASLGEGDGVALTGGDGDSNSEARGKDNYNQGKDGKMNGSKPSNGGGRVDKSGKSGIMNNSGKVSALGANKFKIGFTKKNLDDHFGGVHDHSVEYPGWTKKQYAKRALDLIQSPADGKNILGYRIGTSTVVRYDVRTNDFVKGSPSGGIATMFKPKKGSKYFHDQKRYDKGETNDG